MYPGKTLNGKNPAKNFLNIEMPNTSQDQNTRQNSISPLLRNSMTKTACAQESALQN